MWFVAYLLVMSVICYPIFLYLARPANPIAAWFERIAKTRLIYLFFLLPLLLNLALSPIFPRETNALYNDGAWFAVWASWFGLGFLVARHHQRIDRANHRQALCQCRHRARHHGGALSLRMAVPAEQAIGTYANETPLFKAAIFLLAWSMILTLVGFAARHFNKPDARLVVVNRLVFPLYIVHQTVIVGALYYILPLELAVIASFLMVSS
jgi:glucan biosynthesis protein C